MEAAPAVPEEWKKQAGNKAGNTLREKSRIGN